jgi:hypothetical protein
MLVVVLPTPPFWLVNAVTVVLMSFALQGGKGKSTPNPPARFRGRGGEGAPGSRVERFSGLRYLGIIRYRNLLKTGTAFVIVILIVIVKPFWSSITITRMITSTKKTADRIFGESDM